MTMTTWCALALVLSLTPSSTPQSAAAVKAESAADMKELSSYTLTMETLNKIDRAMRAAVVEIKKDPRFAEAKKIEAEIEALKKKDEPTEADDKRVEELERRLDALKDESMNMSDAQTISQMAAKVEKFAPMMAGLRSAGLTAREYAKFMMAVLQAGLTAGLQKSGVLKEIPAGTNPANVKFMLDHEADFQRMQAAWAEIDK